MFLILLYKSERRIANEIRDRSGRFLRSLHVIAAPIRRLRQYKLESAKHRSLVISIKEIY